jgi:hypothetical protein
MLMNTIRLPLCYLFLLIVLISCTKTEELPTVEITGLRPDKARVNRFVEVTGKGFRNLLSTDSSALFELFIGGLRCDAAVMSDTIIEVFIPANAVSGETCLEWKGKRICGPVPFTLLPGNGIPNSFQKLPPYPGKKNRPSSMFSLNGYIYIGFDDFWKFSVERHTWQRVADMPEWATRTSTFVIRDKAYVFGGLTASAGNGANTLYMYDPVANRWEKKASMPGAGRMDALVFVYDDKAYIIGGHEVYNQPVNQQCWRYDPQTDKWERLPDLVSPAETEGHAYRIGNLFYIPSTMLLETMEFNPVSGSWKVLSSGPKTRFSALHSSARWEMVYQVMANQVFRIVRRFDGQVMADSYHFPVAPGDKQFQLFASAGEELFFMHINEQTYENEFWEYLPE